jgi:hypothetical protein
MAANIGSAEVRCVAFVSYDFCKDMPEKLTADDGRIFRIKKWAPVAEVGSLTDVTCVLAPDVRQMTKMNEESNVSRNT